MLFMIFYAALQIALRWGPTGVWVLTVPIALKYSSRNCNASMPVKTLKTSQFFVEKICRKKNTLSGVAIA